VTDPFASRHPDDLAYPRQTARTAGFSLGIPRNFVISPAGERVTFLRSAAPDDRVNALWVLDVASGEERLVFDPHAHHPEAAEPGPSPAERARRERVRERAGGVVAFACDRDVTKATFVERGRLYVIDLLSGDVQEQATAGVPDDPRLDPTGRRLAYVIEGALYVRDLDDDDRLLVADDDPAVTWGIPDFAAAEEMRRMRAFWWSPDGTRIAATRVDETPVETWWISDPTDPQAAPYAVRYPRTGTANPLVTLHLLDVETAARTLVRWDDAERFEYLARVLWTAGAPLTLLVQSRDQRETRVLEVDETTGATAVLGVETDPAWIDLFEGVPARLDDGTLVTVTDADDRRRLVIGGEIATPASIHVDAIAGTTDAVWFSGWGDDPTQGRVFRVAPGGEPQPVSDEPGDHEAVAGGGLVVLKSYGEDDQHPRTRVLTPAGGSIELVAHTEESVVDPRPIYATLGERELRAALLRPRGHDPDATVPVVLSPYGGPGAAEVVRWRGAYREQQWLADRLGAAVLVIDGRGTPGRSCSWEKAMDRNFTVALDDQVEGLHAAAKEWPFLDLGRVALRGWSFGGWLAAMAVLTRADVFHAGVAGAPVTDFRLYDTHYTERYLGTPQDEPEVYLRDAPLTHAAELSRPLLLIHGLADDNVVAANTLQLSAALFAAGIPHQLELLPNASHIGGSGELVVARHLAELDFLRTSLGLSG